VAAFDDDAAQLFADMEDYAAEPVQLLPRVKELHGRYGADVARDERTVTGVFIQAPASEALEGARRGGDPRGLTQFATVETRLWLSADAVRALGWKPVRGDAVVLRDKQWAVQKAVPTDLGDITLILSKDDPV